MQEHLLTSDPDISAIGDCALFASPRLGVPLRLESVQNATDHARCVAARLTGDAKAYDGLPWFWSAQGPDKLQIAGPYDRLRSCRGARQSGGRIVLDRCYKSDHLIGIESVNRAGGSCVRTPPPDLQPLGHAGAGDGHEFRFEISVGVRRWTDVSRHDVALGPRSR